MTKLSQDLEQSLIQAIQQQDFAALTRNDITVAQAQALIDAHYAPPVELIVQEALEANLIDKAQAGRLGEKVRHANAQQAQMPAGFSRKKLRRYGVSHFRDQMHQERHLAKDTMEIREDRLSADLYFTFGTAADGVMLGWADNRDQNTNDYSDRNQFEGRYLTVDKSGRVYLRALKPVLAAKNVQVDARRTYKAEDEVQQIQAALEKGKSLTFMGLRDPNARARDSYVSGRHYSSLDLIVNKGTMDVLETNFVCGVKNISPDVLGGQETQVSWHNLDALEANESTTVILSARGEHTNDASLFSQAAPHMARALSAMAKRNTP